MLQIQTPVGKYQIKTLSNSTVTCTDLQERSLDSDHRRSQLAQNIWMEDCKENRWTFIRRMLENKNKQGDKGHITRGRYCEIYKSPPTEMYSHVEKMHSNE